MMYTFFLLLLAHALGPSQAPSPTLTGGRE